MTKNEKILLAAVLALALYLYRGKLLGLDAVKEVALAGDPTNGYSTADAADAARKQALGNRTQSQ